jgi:hypothetical protein
MCHKIEIASYFSVQWSWWSTEKPFKINKKKTHLRASQQMIPAGTLCAVK